MSVAPCTPTVVAVGGGQRWIVGEKVRKIGDFRNFNGVLGFVDALNGRLHGCTWQLFVEDDFVTMFIHGGVHWKCQRRPEAH